MVKSLVLFSVTFDKEIIWRYVIPISLDPFIVSLRWFSEKILLEASDIYAEYREDETYFRCILKFINSDNDKFFFDTIDRTILDERNLSINYKKDLYIQLFEKKEYVSFVNKAHVFNMEERNSQDYISSIINTAAEENRALIKFMLHINNKIDSLTDIIRIKENDDIFTKVESVGITKDMIIFHTDKEICEESLGYCEFLLEGENRTRLASVIKIKKLKKSSCGSFYKAKFIEMPTAVNDKIINFLFNKERELIKQSRDFGLN